MMIFPHPWRKIFSRAGKIPGVSCYALIVFCAVFVPVLIPVGDLAASPFRFTGEYGFGRTKDEGQLEFYRQTYGATFNRQVNQGFNYNADIRFTNNWREKGTRDQVLMPSLNMALANDFFQVGLSGSAIERFEDNSADTSDRYVESRFVSKWRKRFIPEMRFSLGQRMELDDEEPRTRDIETTNGNANFDWDIAIGKIKYNYRRQDRINEVALTEDISSGHFAKFDTSRSFFDNRLRVNFSQSYSEDEFEFISTTGAAGTQLLPFTLLQTFYQNDVTPGDNNPALISEGGLSDGDTVNTPPISVVSGQTMEFALNLNPLQYSSGQVDKIYLYTSVDIDALPGVDPYTNFTWALYSNTNLALPWTLEVLTLPPASIFYNPTERRFEFDIPGLISPYIMLVATPTSFTAVDFTEIEAYYNFIGTVGTAFSIETRTRTDKTDFGLNYRFADNLKAAYTLYIENRELSNDVTTDRSSHTGSLNWKPGRYFDSRLQASLTEQDNGTGAESSGRTYSFDVSSPPLPTVDLTYGYLRSVSYTNDVKTQASDAYHINTAARLYKDLSASLDLNFTSTNQEISGTDTENFDSILLLTSRLTPRVDVTLSGRYNEFKSESTSETIATDLTISWRLSDKLLVQGTGNQRWLEETPDQRGGTAKIVLAITPKCQVDLNYSVVDSEDTRQDAAMSMRWNINKLLSAQFNGGYRTSKDVEDWNIGLRITAALGS